MILIERALILRKTTLFEKASLEKICFLSESLTERSLPDAGSVSRESSNEKKLYVVAQGAVRVVNAGKNFHLQEGGYWGELSLFDDTEQLIEAKAEGSALVFEIDGDVARRILIGDVGLAENFIQNLVRRIRSVD